MNENEILKNKVTELEKMMGESEKQLSQILCDVKLIEGQKESYLSTIDSLKAEV